MTSKNTINKIKELFSNYSFKDVAHALLISDLYPLNQASFGQHQLWTGIMISMKADKFGSDDSILSYEDYSKFVEKLYSLTNCLFPAEDYVPNLDWGEVRYPFNDDYYFFFSGTIEIMYDSIKAYEMTIASLDQKIQKLVNRSPKDELLQIFKFQNTIVDAVDLDMDQLRKIELNPGDKRIPTEYFWQRISDFLKNANMVNLFKETFLKAMTVESGDFSEAMMYNKSFVSKILNGNAFCHLFVRHKDQYYPLLIRLQMMIFQDDWGRLLHKHKTVLNDAKKLQKNLNLEITRFISSRIRNERIMRFVSAYDSEKLYIHDIIFSASITYEDKLIFFYNLTPFYESKDIQSELDEMLPKINEAYSLINSDPLIVADHVERNIKQIPSQRGSRMSLTIFVIVSSLNSINENIEVCKKTPVKIITLTQLISLIDSLDNVQQLSDFIDFMKENKSARIVTGDIIDIFSAFIESRGSITYFTNNSNLLILDPHGGAKWRQEQLRLFWQTYPLRLKHPDPRSLSITEETSSFNMIRDKADPFAPLIHVHTSKSEIFLLSHFDIQNSSACDVMQLIMSCVVDYWPKHSFIHEHKFFTEYPGMKIYFLQLENIKGKVLRNYKRMKNLIDSSQYSWVVDSPNITDDKQDFYLRVVVDVDKFLEQMSNPTTNAEEISLMKDILQKCDEIVADDTIDIKLKKLAKLEGQKPRHKFHYVDKPASFPEDITPIKESDFQNRRADKKISEIAKSINLKPGKYSSEAARSKLNQLRHMLVKEIDSLVKSFDYEKSLPICISAMGVTIHSSIIKKTDLHLSLDRDVDFNREKEYINEEVKFIGEHKTYRYLIEKFVQLKPSGEIIITDNDLRYLVYIVTRLLSVYDSSDMIHYIDQPLNVYISKDFAIFVQQSDSENNKQELFIRKSVQAKLAIGVKHVDKIVTYDSATHIDKLNECFKADLGFPFVGLMTILKILTHWSAYSGDAESTYYRISVSKVHKVCADNTVNMNSEEIRTVLEFLELDNMSMLKIKGSSKKAEDLPVWESNKRLHRYNLRPLIKIGRGYIWGAYSTHTSQYVWGNALLNGRLPAEINSPKLITYLEESRRKREKLLEKKALEIVRRFTPFAENVHHNRKTHPECLGDYDVLAYIAEQNILLNIECKDIAPPLVIKDIKRLKEKIFGTKNKKGSISKVEAREDYLKAHISKFADILEWPIREDASIISIHVSRVDYWLTMDVSRITKIKFERIDLLDSMIRDLLRKS